MSNAQNWPDNSASEVHAYLTTIGRTSGKSHRIEIWFAVENGRVFVISGGPERSDWVKNLRENPVITVEIGSEKRAGVAQILKPGTAIDTRARELMVSKYGPQGDVSGWSEQSLGIVIMFGTN